MPEVGLETKVSWGRVLRGGLGAGLVFSLTLLWPGLRLTHFLRAIPQTAAVVFGTAIIVMTFLLTILMVWLYAAVRIRFKPGAKTATGLGASLGMLLAVLEYFGWRFALGRTPGRAWFLNAFVTLFVLAIASAFGAWIYDRPST